MSVIPSEATASAAPLTRHRPPAPGVPGWAGATPHTPAPARFRGRIGREPGSGFRAGPGRYSLYVCPSCPRSLRLAVVRALCGLEDVVGMSVVAPVRGGGDWAVPAGNGHGPDEAGGFRLLREAYERTEHHYDGPVTVPVLWDRWSGRIVSNDAPAIQRDLATRFGRRAPHLYPVDREDEVRALCALADTDIADAAHRAGHSPAGARRAEDLDTVAAALGAVARRRAGHPFLLGNGPTAADVHLWVALVHLDAAYRRHLDAGDVRRLAAHRPVWAYVERLGRLPAFRGRPRPDDGIPCAPGEPCRAPMGTGADVPLARWHAEGAPEGSATRS